MKVKRESEVAQSCPTLCNPVNHSLPGSSVHGIFQARVLEWGAVAFSANTEERAKQRTGPGEGFPQSEQGKRRRVLGRPVVDASRAGRKEQQAMAPGARLWRGLWET